MNFYPDVKKIHIAHCYTLDRAHKCAYPKGRGQYGLVYALRGRAEYRCFSGERFTLAAGELLFLSPHIAYSIATEKEFDHYTVNFDLHAESRVPEQPYCLLKGGNSEPAERVFRRLVTLWQEKRSGYEMLAVGALYELLALFYTAYSGGESDRLRPAREYIERRFAEGFSLEDLAALTHMSTTNFRREWKKRYGESPLQYRDSIRLYYAGEYLRSGYYTVAEVAERCGFEDANYFSRFYKKKTGLTPGEAKKQYFGGDRSE